jgi:hypothetical protein
MTNDKDSAVTQADIDLADAVALAITSVSVAYSHDTNDEMRTVNKRWFAHDSCEGNPFDKEEWLEIFTDKEAAHKYVTNLRQQRASQVVARHRQSQTDALREAWQEYFEAEDELAELERNRDSTSRFDRALYKKSDAEDKARRALAVLQEQSK